MLRINLLPLSERSPKYPIKIIIGLVSCLLLISFTAIYCYNSFIIWNLERQITETRNQYELLKPTQQAMIYAGNKQQTINAKNNILTTLTNERKPWPPIINHLAAMTTPRVWFTEISEADKETLKIIGIAADYQELAAFLRNLEKDKMFADPMLVHADSSPSQAIIGTRYEITVKLRGMK
ncbi:MAG: PilN domain-containing protein [Veillonellaceae bacterium]|jgi:Tfp pilus assembly protein PilN|nr:PilN domain-containing protein [Veillonellaceae bacterium]